MGQQHTYLTPNFFFIFTAQTEPNRSVIFTRRSKKMAPRTKKNGTCLENDGQFSICLGAVQEKKSSCNFRSTQTPWKTNQNQNKINENTPVQFQTTSKEKQHEIKKHFNQSIDDTPRHHQCCCHPNVPQESASSQSQWQYTTPWQSIHYPIGTKSTLRVFWSWWHWTDERRHIGQRFG